jgi:RimJ/RimL family protein N-acetyltransferase
MEFVNKLRNNPGNQNLVVGNKYFVSLERDLRWFDAVAGSDNDRLYLAVCKCGDGECIGYVNLVNIDMRNRNGEWGMILDDKWRGQGFGREALTLLFNYAFDELGLWKVYGRCLAANEMSKALFVRMGFQQEGVMRQHVYKNGEWQDVLFWGLFKPDFERAVTK